LATDLVSVEKAKKAPSFELELRPATALKELLNCSKLNYHIVDISE